MKLYQTNESTQESHGKVTMIQNVGNNENNYHTFNLGNKLFDGT